MMRVGKARAALPGARPPFLQARHRALVESDRAACAVATASHARLPCDERDEREHEEPRQEARDAIPVGEPAGSSRRGEHDEPQGADSRVKAIEALLYGA